METMWIALAAWIYGALCFLVGAWWAGRRTDDACTEQTAYALALASGERHDRYAVASTARIARRTVDMRPVELGWWDGARRPQ